MAIAAVKRKKEEGFTPAFLVADNILGNSPNNDFMFSLRFRHHEETGSWDQDIDEVQGYVDVIAAYTCWSYMELGRCWDDPISEILIDSPTFDELPENVLKSALLFAEHHRSWARMRVKPSDIVDGRNIMPKIAALVASGNYSDSYKRGAETAYQTFLLFVHLILTILET
jgi:hypothetical protein